MLPVLDKDKGECSQPVIGLSTGSPMEELEKGLKELRDLPHRGEGREGGNSINRLLGAVPSFYLFVL